MAGPDFITVLSAERTAGTSVANSLRAAYPAAEGLHVHYLDRPSPGGTGDAAETAFQAAKRDREARVKLRLSDPALHRVLFAILRRPSDRMASVMWYLRAQAFAALYRPSSRDFAPEAEGLALKLLRKQASALSYEDEVYAPLGFAAAPGLHVTPSGVQAAVLRFERLEQDFRSATTALFGYPAPLLHLNAAKEVEPPGCYAAFRSFVRPLMLEAGIADDYPGLEGQPAWPDAAGELARRKRAAWTAELEGDWRAQIGAWEEVLATAPSDVQAHRNLARLRSDRGEHDRAALHLRALAETQPLVAKGWIRLAGACREARDLEGELEAWRRLCALEKATQRSLSRITSLLRELGRTEEAAQAKAELRRLIG